MVQHMGSASVSVELIACRSGKVYSLLKRTVEQLEFNIRKEQGKYSSSRSPATGLLNSHMRQSTSEQINHKDVFGTTPSLRPISPLTTHYPVGEQIFFSSQWRLPNGILACVTACGLICMQPKPKCTNVFCHYNLE